MPNNHETVLITMLRQPRLGDIKEMRSDPFWEFGSFGLTGCHQRNMLHPKRAMELSGARLAFVQGGEAGFKLVYLTPPVTPIPYRDRTEVRWDGGEMPFRFESAPLIIDPSGGSHMPELLKLIQSVNRNGWMGRFASKFRTRREPLPAAATRQLVEVYERTRRHAEKQAFARLYTDALPFNPPKTDYDRRRTYEALLAAALAGAHN
ncbi:MAG TPA: hypothetical protein V6D17_11605 [Candidatus Obscuribacterales bacterium]